MIDDKYALQLLIFYLTFIRHLLGILEARFPARNDIKLIVRKFQSFVYPNGDGNGAFLRVLQHNITIIIKTMESDTNFGTRSP